MSRVRHKIYKCPECKQETPCVLTEDFIVCPRCRNRNCPYYGHRLVEIVLCIDQLEMML